LLLKLGESVTVAVAAFCSIGFHQKNKAIKARIDQEATEACHE